MLGSNLDSVDFMKLSLNEGMLREIRGVVNPSKLLCLYDPGMTSVCPTHVSVRNVAECYLEDPDVYLHRFPFAFGL